MTTYYSYHGNYGYTGWHKECDKDGTTTLLFAGKDADNDGGYDLTTADTIQLLPMGNADQPLPILLPTKEITQYCTENEWYGGEITADLMTYQSVPVTRTQFLSEFMWLYYACGNSTTTVSGDYWTHAIINDLTGRLPSIAIGQQLTNTRANQSIVNYAIGGHLKRLEWAWERGKPIVETLEFIFKKMTMTAGVINATNIPVATEIATPIPSGHVYLPAIAAGDLAALEDAGTGAAYPIQSGRLTIENEFNEEQVNDSNQYSVTSCSGRQCIARKTRLFLTVNVADYTILKEYVDYTNGFTAETVIVVSIYISTNKYCTITINRPRFVSVTSVGAIPAQVEIELTGTDSRTAGAATGSSFTYAIKDSLYQCLSDGADWYIYDD